jgi:heme ABC exporter ATP-binding subunit CcmA
LTASPPAKSAIEARGITKSFHTQPVLRGLDLTLAWGECLALFGPNGSGKTTLVRVLSTIARQDGGSLRVAGYDSSREALAVRQGIGVLMHQTFLYDHLTGLENLRFYARMYGVPDSEARIRQVTAQMHAEPFLHRRVLTLSHGMQKRIALARALLHAPRVLLLDEPESGLDQEALGLMADALRRHCGAGGAVLMTTHNVEAGLGMANRVGVLAGGRLAYETATVGVSPAAFREAYARAAGSGA